ncbi:hypothetical protein HanRHA438_Chr02g0057001 [Helianthus annuus]|uniref:Uncharacterized protein n=1 Tax=Helianthus annuus TaxID=4232 RepID=A0A251RSE2_HELAN|nr:hypothetical protein HanXRQr2_Chr02g0055341 [Helianthus annuus]KAJ0604069.1 hypothetical protein HanHA300_Chr02g0045501 [Helianthus annuus]KAJ0618079.1 hypothetical protein HanHA89_Chr02g0049141 [Helianthus annuus]KAJ0939076.1 hypothetical protein HanRHA438_Chr02g0057001 [Helianthus annuus]KAJ0950972.1 hypothetical protein HanPSC8_Chr02g0054571 [Helianthus annuus]
MILVVNKLLLCLKKWRIFMLLCSLLHLNSKKIDVDVVAFCFRMIRKWLLSSLIIYAAS